MVWCQSCQRSGMRESVPAAVHVENARFRRESTRRHRFSCLIKIWSWRRSHDSQDASNNTVLFLTLCSSPVGDTKELGQSSLSVKSCPPGPPQWWVVTQTGQNCVFWSAVVQSGLRYVRWAQSSSCSVVVVSCCSYYGQQGFFSPTN